MSARILLSLKLFSAFFFAASAISAPAFGLNLELKKGGNLSVELVRSDATYTNILYIYDPNDLTSLNVEASGCEHSWGGGGVAGFPLMNEKKAQYGCRIYLEPVKAGTVLEFSLCVDTDMDNVCDHIWSSEPSKNSDGFDHVRIDEIYPEVYQLSWEDKPKSESDDDFDDLIAIVRVDMDSDGDGLWDDWEINGIDTNGDGNPDYIIPGADPYHKDIFVEIDYMDCVQGGDCEPGDDHNHYPSEEAIEMVIQAFANAPVDNPDGKQGINLHVDISDPIPHEELLDIDSESSLFDSMKSSYFDSSDFRRFVYHYAIFGHDHTRGSGGQAELWGNDLFVARKTSPNESERIMREAGTFMHELGHNLNLDHGGGDCINKKPNYLSVMNYLFQGRGIPPSGRLDFSGEALLDLDENNLDENKGIQDGSDETINLVPLSNKGADKQLLVPGYGAIDWNDNGILEGNITLDLNEECEDLGKNCNCGDKSLIILEGYNDWVNLVYSFQSNSENFADGAHFNVASPEMSYAEFVENTPPRIDVIYPQENQSIQNGLFFTADTSSIRDVSEVYFSVQNLNFSMNDPVPNDFKAYFNINTGLWESYFDSSLVPDGNYLLLSKAIDSEGGVGYDLPVSISVKNWVVTESLPSTKKHKAGRTMPVKFTLHMSESSHPEMPFVYNEELEILIYDPKNPGDILQVSTFGTGSEDYRIDDELYITNFKTEKTPATYVVEIWKRYEDFLVGSFTFETSK